MSFSVCRASCLTVLVLGSSGCGGATETNDRCLVDLAPITVRTHELTVGDTVTFEASLGPRDCLPSDIVAADWRWSSGDTLIALIDPLSGFTQGISPGDVTIEVRHAQNRFVSSGTGLQVVAETGR